MKRHAQAFRAQAEQSSRALDTANQAREFRYGWIPPHAAMAHLGIHSLSALYRLITEHGLPFGRVGRRYRFRRDHLDQWTERRGPEALAMVAKRA